eukprot:TRINITY_DN5791_c0_g1_i2.p3 TRINITY_DN5791_c0_g1~~TRINITY_DN5791_c0_g1_i2.p3  ORF type:complete len:138 (-),score=24.97 TRINITY_DN5791_c0_g1_i2:25-438(-)
MEQVPSDCNGKTSNGRFVAWLSFQHYNSNIVCLHYLPLTLDTFSPSNIKSIRLPWKRLRKTNFGSFNLKMCGDYAVIVRDQQIVARDLNGDRWLHVMQGPAWNTSSLSISHDKLALVTENGLLRQFIFDFGKLSSNN